MKRSYHTEDTEPESNFKLPNEGEYLFQVTDVNPLVEADGENENIQIAKIEIIGGEFEGISLLNRCNLNQDEKYDFSSFTNVKVADMIIYSSVSTYVSTIPLCYPHLELESEIHPDHITEHTKAINSIINILKNTDNIYYKK